MKINQIRKLTVMAMISALGFVAMFLFRFNVSFLTFDFKDAVMSISALLYGPLSGVICAVIVALFESITVGDTGIYGLIMDILSSSAFLVSCGIVYKHKRSFSGAIIAAVCSAVSVTAVMAVANIFITPYYMGVKSADVIAMLPTLLLPFNLSKGLMNASVMLLIYKPVTNILRKTHLLPPTDKTSGKIGIRSVLLTVGTVTVLILTVLFVMLYLNGEFTLFDV